MSRAIARFAIGLSAGATLGAAVGSVPAYAVTLDQNPTALALQALHNYAACAVKRTPAGATKMLSLDPNSDAFKRARMRFGKGHGMCEKQGDMLRTNPMLFAGNVAEALMAKYPAGSLVSAATRKDVKPRNMVEETGICVAEAKPEDVAAIFATEPGSKDELAALNKTAALLPGCVKPGQTIKLNRPAARAIYALGAYRLLVGNPENLEG